MTEEIKYYKEKEYPLKWIPAEEMEETPQQTIDRLKQENKELKVVKEQLKKWNDENLKRQDEMQLWIDLAEEQRKKYRSALEEIKEIATNYFEECGVPDDYFKRNNYSWKQHQIKAFTCKLQQIIDKINEALGNEI